MSVYNLVSGDCKMSHEEIGKLTYPQFINLCQEGKWDQPPAFDDDLEGARAYSKWLAEQDQK